MEGNGGGSGSLWDLGISWSAPPTSACQPFPPQQLLLQQQQLGKRPFFWGGEGHELAASDQTAGTSGSGGVEGRRKERALGAGAAVAAVPRCQVVGCHVALAGAKEYHRRHKVCELHSKAPMVVVLGVEQRFCQQCSRFHAMMEFDDAKRSCRRRLARHNARRRKSNASEATARSSAAQPFDEEKQMVGGGGWKMEDSGGFDAYPSGVHGALRLEVADLLGSQHQSLYQ